MQSTNGRESRKPVIYKEGNDRVRYNIDVSIYITYTTTLIDKISTEFYFQELWLKPFSRSVEQVLKEFLLSKVFTSFWKPPTLFLHPIALAADGKYNIPVMKRSVNPPTVTELSSLLNITIVPGDGYDEATP